LYVYLSKILPLFVMPVGLVLVLSLLALLFLLKKMRKTAAGLLMAAVAVLWAASTPIVAHKLYAGLEARYPPRTLESIPGGDCIVVLGGSLGAPLSPRIDVEFNEAIDRVYKTAKLFNAGKGRIVIVTAGNQPWSESRWAEAELIRDLLVEWGVPNDSIMLEGSSRNTRENAVYSRNIINAIGCSNTLLVTSAAHMPRAVAAFREAGVIVTPISTDVRITQRTRFNAVDYLPDAQALAMTSEAIREWIGRAVYSVKGWN
jgi:uncharacterized SAM-binding protein YcdF (DUF218 family)